MGLFVKPTLQDIVHIKQSYADVVAKFKDELAIQITLYKIQNVLNDNARRIYDKFGRIIIKLAENSYIDITCPKASFKEDIIRVDFVECTKEGKLLL